MGARWIDKKGTCRVITEESEVVTNGEIKADAARDT
jgi:hypothetical protein